MIIVINFNVLCLFKSALNFFGKITSNYKNCQQIFSRLSIWKSNNHKCCNRWFNMRQYYWFGCQHSTVETRFDTRNQPVGTELKQGRSLGVCLLQTRVLYGIFYTFRIGEVNRFMDPEGYILGITKPQFRSPNLAS